MFEWKVDSDSRKRCQILYQAGLTLQFILTNWSIGAEWWNRNVRQVTSGPDLVHKVVLPGVVLIVLTGIVLLYLPMA